MTLHDVLTSRHRLAACHELEWDVGSNRGTELRMGGRHPQYRQDAQNRQEAQTFHLHPFSCPFRGSEFLGALLLVLTDDEVQERDSRSFAAMQDLRALAPSGPINWLASDWKTGVGGGVRTLDHWSRNANKARFGVPARGQVADFSMTRYASTRADLRSDGQSRVRLRNWHRGHWTSTLLPFNRCSYVESDLGDRARLPEGYHPSLSYLGPLYGLAP